MVFLAKISKFHLKRTHSKPTSTLGHFLEMYMVQVCHILPHVWEQHVVSPCTCIYVFNGKEFHWLLVTWRSARCNELEGIFTFHNFPEQTFLFLTPSPPPPRPLFLNQHGGGSTRSRENTDNSRPHEK